MSVSGESLLHRIKLAAKRDGREVQAMATMYAIERFIARMNVADPEGRASVKGGQSLGIIFGNSSRPTKDLDINVDLPDVADPVEWCEDMVSKAGSLNLLDGVTIDGASMRMERREHQGEGGLRVHINASIHTCRVPFVVDVGINNEMSFEPTDHSHSGVLGLDSRLPPPVDVKLYPFENTIAEKLVSKIEDGAASIRHKDFFDIWLAYEICLRVGDFALLTAKRQALTDGQLALVDAVHRGIKDGSMLSLPERGIEIEVMDRLGYALLRTAMSRGAVLPNDLTGFLRTEFADDESQSSQWANWCRNNGRRLLFQPPGTGAGVDRARSFHVLFDRLDAFVSGMEAALPHDDVVSLRNRGL